jgi:hypothetical protein
MRIGVRVFIAVLSAGIGLTAGAQARPHYRELQIPGTQRFPVPESDLLRMRDEQNVNAMRAHAWNLFAGLTDAGGPEAKNAPVWDSWYTKCDVELARCLPPNGRGSNQERLMRGFALPTQDLFEIQSEMPRALDEIAQVKWMETTILGYIKQDPQFASVLYNKNARNHILRNRLYAKQELDRTLKARLDTHAPEPEREIAPFPRDSVVLKTAWQLVEIERSGKGTLWLWDPQLERQLQSMNNRLIPAARNWGKSVTIDTKLYGCRDRDYEQNERIPIDCFYAFPINKDVPFWDELVKTEVNNIPHSPKSDYYMVLMAVHVATKETADWVWATFWWYNYASDPNYGWDRPPKDVLKGNKWRHFLMDTTLSGNTPLELDYGNKICFNRYLEEKFPNGMLSNCIQCHERAVYSPKNQDIKANCGYSIALRQRCTETAEDSLPKCADLALPPSCQQPIQDYYNGVLQTDFLWTIPESQNPVTDMIQQAFIELLVHPEAVPKN